jgi:DNA-binding beta-propeller fold protein YncE
MLTYVESTAAGVGPRGITFDATATHAYVVNYTDNTTWTYNVNSNGVLTYVESVATGNEPIGIALSQ